MVQALLVALSCGPKEAPVEAAPEPKVRVLRGPWTEDAEMLAVASTGQFGGPSIIVAVWVDEGVLSTATSLDAGRGWTPPREIDQGVLLDETGQMWPRLGLALGRPVVAYVVEGEVRLAEGGAEGWTHTVVGEGIATGLDMAMVWDEPVVVWTDHVGMMRSTGGQELGQGACVCCRAAIQVVDGDVRFVPSRTTACDGPTDDGGDLLMAVDGVVTRAGEVRPPILEGWIQSQARGVNGIDAWLESDGESVRPVLGGLGLITAGSAILGDPVFVAGEVWLPFWADRTVLVAWRPADDGLVPD